MDVTLSRPSHDPAAPLKQIIYNKIIFFKKNNINLNAPVGRTAANAACRRNAARNRYFTNFTAAALNFPLIAPM